MFFRDRWHKDGTSFPELCPYHDFCLIVMIRKKNWQGEKHQNKLGLSCFKSFRLEKEYCGVYSLVQLSTCLIVDLITDHFFQPNNFLTKNIFLTIVSTYKKVYNNKHFFSHKNFHPIFNHLWLSLAQLSPILFSLLSIISIYKQEIYFI